MRLRYAYFDQNGTPMELEVSGKMASSFEFALDPKGVLRLETSGEGNPKVGWARVTMDRHLSGSAIFRIFEVGRSPARRFASGLRSIGYRGGGWCHLPLPGDQDSG